MKRRRHITAIVRAIAGPALLALGLLPPAPAGAQPHGAEAAGTGYFVKRYSQDEGLAGNAAYLLCRDRQGFLWTGGFQGLSRFDGARFTVFGTRDGLPANTIDALRTDTAGYLYVSSGNRVFRYTGRTPAPFRPCAGAVTGGSMGPILPVDSGHLYLSDISARRLYYLSGGRLHPVALHTVVMGLERDAEGYVYVFTSQNRIFILKDSTVIADVAEPLYRLSYGQTYMYVGLKKDAAGRVYYVGHQVYRLAPRPPYVSRYHAYSGSPALYSYNLGPSPAGGRLYRYGDTTWTPVLPFPSGLDVNSALLPEGDRFWLVSYNGLAAYYPGLYHTEPYDLLRHYYRTVNGCRVLCRDSSLAGDARVRRAVADLEPKRIVSVYRAGDGSTWFCTYYGIYYLLPGDQKPRAFTWRLKNDWVSNVVKAAVEDGEGRIWFETYNGSFCYDRGRFRHWDEQDGALSDQAIYAGITDGAGTYYAAGTELYAWPKDLPRLPGRVAGLRKDAILSLGRDREGNVWACPNEPKLLKISRDAGGKLRVTDSLELTAAGTPYIAQSITFDKEGNLWAAATGRLAIYLRGADGRFSDTRKRVLGADQQVQRLTRNRSFLYTSAGRDTVYLRQDTILAVFDAAALLAAYHTGPPRPVLTGVELFRKAQNWGAPGFTTDRYGLPLAPVLQSGQNSPTFLFTGITDAEPEAVTYRYRLAGYDKRWQPVTTLREAGYTNLPPGTYTFYVAAANINGQWSAPVAFPFRILPPWYNTWWARALWAALGAGLTGLVFAWRLRAVKRKAGRQRLLLESQLKALRAQINPHFLQNTFGFLSDMVEERPAGEIRQVISQLSSYLRNVLDRTDETVVRLEDELAFAEEYLAVNLLLFPGSFRYVINVAEEVDTISFRVPSLLLQPLLENAVKHGSRSPGAGAGTISVSVYVERPYLKIVICNPLPGAHKNDRAAGYRPVGLRNTEERVRLLYKGSKTPPIFAAEPAPAGDAAGGMDYRVVLALPYPEA